MTTNDEPALKTWVDNFIRSKRAERLSESTITNYSETLKYFAGWCDLRGLAQVEDLTPDLLRQYLLDLEGAGHNPGGVHGYYRSLKTFLFWYELECSPVNWPNPIRRVKAPRLPELILDPVDLEDVRRMVATCEGSTGGLRDRALILALLDTGARASELTGFDLKDLDAGTMELHIEHGKGGKWRAVFLGEKARRAMRAYLRARGRVPGPLFLSKTHGRLTYAGLREIIRRRARAAGLDQEPALHSFRRAFAVNFLRNGGNLLALQRLLGHADMQLLRRYAKQNTDDLRGDHAANSPADRL